MGEAVPTDGPTGCYLVYVSDSGGKLMLHYSQGVIPENAVGFWCPGEGKKIQGFKFKQAGGRSDLIKGIMGGDSNRKKYFVGWCQFIKLAKAMKGNVIKFPNAEQGVEVDVYGYKQSESKPSLLKLDDGMVNVEDLDAVTVLPMHNTKLRGIHTMTLNNFLEAGNMQGASTTLA